MIWLSIIACVTLAFLFSGIEAGILAIKRARLRHNARLGSRAATQLEALLKKPGRLIVTVTLVNNLARIIGLALLFGVLSERFGPTAAAAVLVVLLPVFALVFELLPKALFRAFPYRILAVFGRVLTAASYVLWPFARATEWLASPVLRVWKEKAGHRLAGTDEIRQATDEATRASVLAPLQKHFIHSVLNARETTVGELAIAMKRVVRVPSSASVTEALDLARTKNVNRIPVVDGDGTITGLLTVFDLLIDDVREGTVAAHARRIVSIPAEESLAAALVKLRAARASVAAVTENNRPAGIVTSRDIVAKMLAG